MKGIAIQGSRAFLLIWLGQLVSITGSTLTSFALGVWVYSRTGSVTQYSLLLLAASLPGIVLSPFVGALVDRWGQRLALVLSDGGGAVVALALVALFFSGQLQIWELYVLLSLASICRAAQLPAFLGSITLLVPKAQFGRAAGLVQVAQAVPLVIGPAAGAALLALTSVAGVILIDFATFLFSLASLALIRVAAAPPLPGAAGKPSLLREAAAGWRFIRERPGLIGLLGFFFVVNFNIAVVQALLTPMILDFSNAATLGTVLSVGSVGMLLGSLAMSAWGGPRRRVDGVLGFGILFGVGLFASGLRAAAALIAAAFFLSLFTVPFVNASSQAIWQSKVAAAIQGRVFAVRQMMAWSSIPLGYLLAGPVADRIFKPLLRPGGPLVPVLGPLLGVGPGRGIGLLFMILGCLTMLTCLAGYAFAPLREIEQRLPDQLPAATAA
ncbi:MAG: MFS transporter [Acidobacteria bacterium]|nr:MFS transporter [Acidobacteriota bacterium]